MSSLSPAAHEAEQANASQAGALIRREVAQGIYATAYRKLMKSRARVPDVAFWRATDALAYSLRLLPHARAVAVYQQLQGECRVSPHGERFLALAVLGAKAVIGDADTNDSLVRAHIAGLAIGFGRLAEFLHEDFHTTPRELPVDRLSAPKFLLERLPPGTLPADPQEAPPSTSASDDGVVAPEPPGTATIQQVLDDWLRPFSRPEQSRRRSAVQLLVKVAGLGMAGDISALRRLDADTGRRFHELSLAVGGGWGQAGEDASLDAATLLKLVAGPSAPRWSQKPLADRGARSRIAHARAFLMVVQKLGVCIPAIDWPKP